MGDMEFVLKCQISPHIKSDVKGGEMRENVM